jgi:hypothetical protein
VGKDIKKGQGWIPAFAGMTVCIDVNIIRTIDRDCHVAALLAMTER